MEMKGVPPSNLLDECSRKHHFFNTDGSPHQSMDSNTGKILRPNSKSIQSHIICEDKAFLKFIDGCLHWDPDLRLSPEEALRHEWILEGIPLNMQKSYRSLVGLQGLDSEEEEEKLE